MHLSQIPQCIILGQKCAHRYPGGIWIHILLICHDVECTVFTSLDWSGLVDFSSTHIPPVSSRCFKTLFDPITAAWNQCPVFSHDLLRPSSLLFLLNAKFIWVFNQCPKWCSPCRNPWIIMSKLKSQSVLLYISILSLAILRTQSLLNSRILLKIRSNRTPPSSFSL